MKVNGAVWKKYKGERRVASDETDHHLSFLFWPLSHFGALTLIWFLTHGVH